PEVLPLAGDLLQDRCDHAARPAPGRPEVDEDGVLGLEDVSLEARVGDVGQGAGHGGAGAPWGTGTGSTDHYTKCSAVRPVPGRGGAAAPGPRAATAARAG